MRFCQGCTENVSNRPVAELLRNEKVAVECMNCGLRMTSYVGSSGRVRYFRCAACHRWVSSTYADVLRADAKVRAIRPKPERTGDISQLKDKLEHWLAAREEQDPFRVLGVSRSAGAQAVRARYHALALERHPDRGGSAEAMRELNSAYERVCRHLANFQTDAAEPSLALARASTVL
jgi:hypothetical protein